MNLGGEGVTLSARGPSLLCPKQTRHIDSMLDQCWPNVLDGGPTLAQHWIDVSCLLGQYLTSVDDPRTERIKRFTHWERDDPI